VGGAGIAALERHGLERHALPVQPQALGAVGIDERLAVLDPQQGVGRRLLAGKRLEHRVVVDDAVLIDLDEARSLVLKR